MGSIVGGQLSGCQLSGGQLSGVNCRGVNCRGSIVGGSIVAHPLNSLDFKSAFLQGDAIKREVYLKPPREAETQGVWRLRKCVYGLKDASRLWWLRLNAALIGLGLTRLS